MYDNGVEHAFVSKRIILNGDNLVDAIPEWILKIMRL